MSRKDDYELGAMSAYDLVEFLDKAFPSRCIMLGETETDAHRYAGARDLIDQLVSQVNDERDVGYEPSL